MPDLASGIELKTLSKASSVNTLNGYLKNASRKRGCTAVVFDNTDNTLLSDAEVSDLLLKCMSLRAGRVYVLGKSGLTLIR